MRAHFPEQRLVIEPMLRTAILDEFQINLEEGRGGQFGRKQEVFLASLPRLRQYFDARPLCTYMKPRWPHVPRR